MRGFRIALYIVVAVVIVIAGAGAWATRFPAIAPVTKHPVFDAATIARGAQLAALGYCSSCHTAEGGTPYAGGRPVPTPFGIVYATNITPDRDTGIGKWSEAAFRRAMRDGIDRRGQHLYPAFPYNHFTKATDGDIEALYAYLMSLHPVSNPHHANRLPFPISWRPVVAGWNLFFLDRGAYMPDPGKSAEWNRGAYLAEGLGHCGACHTPKNFLGAEDHGKRFAGAKAEGWYAPPLNGASPSPVRWTADTIATYLRHGFESDHGKALGPMQEVTGNLARLPQADIDALATYIASFEPAADKSKSEAAVAAADKAAYGPVHLASTLPDNGGNSAGAKIFAAACATCHHAGGGLPDMRPVRLGLSTPVWMNQPTNLIQIILHGISPPVESPGVSMPPFADVLTDKQVADLVTYIRGHFSDRPAWSDLAESVRQVRSDGPHGAGEGEQMASQGQNQ